MIPVLEKNILKNLFLLGILLTILFIFEKNLYIFLAAIFSFILPGIDTIDSNFFLTGNIKKRWVAIKNEKVHEIKIFYFKKKKYFKIILESNNKFKELILPTFLDEEIEIEETSQEGIIITEIEEIISDTRSGKFINYQNKKFIKEKIRYKILIKPEMINYASNKKKKWNLFNYKKERKNEC